MPKNNDQDEVLKQRREEIRQSLIMQEGLWGFVLLTAADSIPPGTPPALP